MNNTRQKQRKIIQDKHKTRHETTKKRTDHLIFVFSRPKLPTRHNISDSFSFPLDPLCQGNNKTTTRQLHWQDYAKKWQGRTRQYRIRPGGTRKCTTPQILSFFPFVDVVVLWLFLSCLVLSCLVLPCLAIFWHYLASGFVFSWFCCYGALPCLILCMVSFLVCLVIFLALSCFIVLSFVLCIVFCCLSLLIWCLGFCLFLPCRIWCLAFVFCLAFVLFSSWTAVCPVSYLYLIWPHCRFLSCQVPCLLLFSLSRVLSVSLSCFILSLSCLPCLVTCYLLHVAC